MAKHVILATEAGAAERYYFSGYKDDWDRYEIAWSLEITQAVLLNALEIRTETLLLAKLCPGYVIRSLRMDEISRPNSG